MRFSRLSAEEAREIREAAADPSFREMNRVEGELAAKLAGKSPEENVRQLVAWLKILSRLGVRFEPSRELPRADVSLL